MGFMEILSLIANLMPVVSQVVGAVETSMPGAPGAEKLAAATRKIENVLPGLKTTAEAVMALKAAIPNLINGHVAAINAAAVAAAAPVLADRRVAERRLHVGNDGQGHGVAG